MGIAWILFNEFVVVVISVVCVCLFSGLSADFLFAGKNTPLEFWSIYLVDFVDCLSISGSLPPPRGLCASRRGFFYWKNTPREFWSMYLVDFVDCLSILGSLPPPRGLCASRRGFFSQKARPWSLKHVSCGCCWFFVDFGVPPTTPWSMCLPQGLCVLKKTHPWIFGHMETVPRHISRFQFWHFEKSIFVKIVEHLDWKYVFSSI